MSNTLSVVGGFSVANMEFGMGNAKYSAFQ